MTGEALRGRGLRAFESPEAFSRACVRVAVALVIVGVAGLVDRLYVLPLAGLVLAIAALTWLAGTDVLDDPPDPAMARSQVDRTVAASSASSVSVSSATVAAPEPSIAPEPAPETLPGPSTIPDPAPSTIPDPGPSTIPATPPSTVPDPSPTPPETEPVVPEPDPAPVVPEPDPEPVVPEPDPAPVVPQPDPEPVVPEPDPEPATAGTPVGAAVPRTFELPAAVGAQEVALVGDFNGWSRTAHRLRREGDRFTTTVELEPGRAYRYRYLLDGDRWENDWSADEYAPNAFGTEDSVVRT